MNYPAWMDVLINISDNVDSITILARDMKASYTHVFNIIKDLESKNILTVMKNGRDNKITLTPKGIKIVVCLDELRLLMDSED